VPCFFLPSSVLSNKLTKLQGMCSFIWGHFAGQFQFLSKSDKSNRRFTCVCGCKSTGMNQIFVTTRRSQTKFPDINAMYILLPAFSFAKTRCLNHLTPNGHFKWSYRTANLQMLHFLNLFNKYTY
jgi:hypothetical protein